MQQKENAAGGPRFKVGAEVIQPQQNHEAFSQNCQEKYYSSVHLLADMLDRHLALRNEIAVLRAENARLRMLARGCA